MLIINKSNYFVVIVVRIHHLENNLDLIKDKFTNDEDLVDNLEARAREAEGKKISFLRQKFIIIFFKQSVRLRTLKHF